MLAKQFFLLGFFTLITCAAFAQPVGVGVELSPVPIWPKSGVIPIELQDRYVFLDPEAGELVLAYPEDVGSALFRVFMPRRSGYPLPQCRVLLIFLQHLRCRESL